MIQIQTIGSSSIETSAGDRVTWANLSEEEAEAYHHFHLV
jgi:hypothetical protein